MNRPDFMIRQLEYYIKVKCPHPIYIGDASNEENKRKFQTALEKLSEHLTIHYYAQLESITIPESRLNLYTSVIEKYCVFSGDDDYQIPNSITRCAEFLENNPEYSSASGYSVAFRLTNNGVYGELKRLSDYPRGQIESLTAAQRLIEMMTKFSITEFSVQKTKDMIKCLTITGMKDRALSTDVLPSAMSSVLGKSKILDCLSLIRQLDNPKESPIDSFDWFTGKNFNSSYEIWRETLAKEISTIDNISMDEALKSAKKALWSYFNVNLPTEYSKLNPARTDGRKKSNRSLLSKLRLRVGKSLPWLKNIYLRMSHSLPNAPKEIFYEVTQPSSPYYKDFKPVLDSFTGEDRRIRN